MPVKPSYFFLLWTFHFAFPTLSAADPVTELCQDGRAALAGEEGIEAGETSPPGVVPFHDQESPAVELDRVGTLLRPGDNIADLPDGTYVYLIYNAKGLNGADQVIVERRIPIAVEEEAKKAGQIPEKYLATHRGLLRQLSEKLGIPVDEVKKHIVGAGQVETRNGVVARVDNKSGTFRGDTGAFEYSQRVLAKYGVVPEVNSRIFDISQAPINPLTGERRVPDHQNDATEAEYAMTNLINPDIASARVRLQESHRKLFPWLASQEKDEAGRLDIIKLLDYFEDHDAAIRAKLPEKYRNEDVFTQVINMGGVLQVWQAESIDVAIHNLENHYQQNLARQAYDPSYRAEPVLSQLERMLAYFQAAQAVHEESSNQ